MRCGGPPTCVAERGTGDGEDSTRGPLLFRNRVGRRVWSRLVAKDDSEVDDGELFGERDDGSDAVDPD